MSSLKKKKVSKPKAKPLRWYKAKFDANFSRWVRQRDKHKCFTCGKQMNEKESQCGHYVSRSHMNTRWDETNNNCQCYGCNICKKGNMDVYALRLIAKYGDQILYELQIKKNKIKQWTIKELQALIEKYQNPF